MLLMFDWHVIFLFQNILYTDHYEIIVLEFRQSMRSGVIIKKKIVGLFKILFIHFYTNSKMRNEQRCFYIFFRVPFNRENLTKEDAKACRHWV